MTADILRQKFLDFFKSKKHKIVESDSLVPKDDPTVLFTPAGMNQFKKQFLGMVTDFRRAATSQRCMRTDDLEKVGKTAVHHTFFEMLGNFSFGDYFKRDAIAWAWEFLTEELKIPPGKLWISVYKDDDEAYAIWKNDIKVPAHKILKLGDKDNFWPAEAKEKGPNGPCGPCSEIFFDFGKEVGCKEPACDPTCSCGRFAEIWNLVFTQFNRKEGGILEPLPQKNIDTGMGLERLAAVMQGKKNNFETDLFQPLLREIERIEQKNEEYLPWEDDIGEKDLLCIKESRYAIADHIRAIVFSIYDGVLPSNEGRGYVIRKLIRKSAFYFCQTKNEPFLYTLVPLVAEIMAVPYPELKSRQENIAEIILAEEKGFIQTLNAGNIHLKEKFAGFAKKQDAHQAGIIAFQLYDTYGIPLEVTSEWLKKNDIVFSQEAFDNALAEQKNRSKSKSAMKGDVFSLQGNEFKLKPTLFVGHQKFNTPAKILKILKNSQEVKKISRGEEAQVILDKSAFYAESGGQVGDTGKLIKGKNIFEVTDTKKIGKVFLHCGKVFQGSFRVQGVLQAQLDIERRLAIGRNHTATHLLQSALRQVLGEHVQQQGSMVAPERLRFDFTHFKGLSEDELKRVEEVVNNRIIEDHSLTMKQMPLAQAKKSGALAFFAEKYEGTVRVVQMGDFSKEFCGGTHLKNTGQIGFFKIIHEGSVASGIRRIEAVTGAYAHRLVQQEKAVIDELCQALKVPRQNLVGEVEKRLAQLKELEKKLNAKKLDTAQGSLDSLVQEAEEINGIKVIAQALQGLDMGLLRTNADILKKKMNGAVIALGSGADGKAMLVVALTQDLLARGLDASKIIIQAASLIGGSGGGRKDFAQAGGTQPENFPKAFEALKEAVRQAL